MHANYLNAVVRMCSMFAMIRCSGFKFIPSISEAIGLAGHTMVNDWQSTETIACFIKLGLSDDKDKNW